MVSIGGGSRLLRRAFLFMEYITEVQGTFFTTTPPTPYPKKKPTQYWKCSRTFTDQGVIHSQWYSTHSSKKGFLKVIPANIKEYFGPETQAFLLMSDGYWSMNTVFICTDNFSNLKQIYRQNSYNLSSIRKLVQKNESALPVDNFVTELELAQKNLICRNSAPWYNRILFLL